MMLYTIYSNVILSSISLSKMLVQFFWHSLCHSKDTFVQFLLSGFCRKKYISQNGIYKYIIYMTQSTKYFSIAMIRVF